MGLLSRLFGKKYEPFLLIAPTAHPDRVFRVHPKGKSHSKKPYLVKIVYTCNTYFETWLIGDIPCKCCKEKLQRRFTYDSLEWKNYHHDRFELVGWADELK